MLLKLTQKQGRSCHPSWLSSASGSLHHWGRHSKKYEPFKCVVTILIQWDPRFKFLHIQQSLLIRAGVNKKNKYQPSGARGTCSPSAGVHHLQNRCSLSIQCFFSPAGVRVFPSGILQYPQEILTKTLIIEQILWYFENNNQIFSQNRLKINMEYANDVSIVGGLIKT